MMLKALYDLSKRDGVLEDPDFQKRRIDFILTVGHDGSFRGLEKTQDEKGRGRERERVPRAPEGRTVGVKPAFLVDNAQYVLNVSKANAKKADRAEQCAKAFTALVRAAADAIQDEGLLAVARFCEGLEGQRRRVLAAAPGHEWTGDETIAFAFEGDGTTLVHERDRVRAYWKELQGGGGDEKGETKLARCLITGDIGPIARLHPAIKNVPQAQSSGAFLVSFNAPAFESHGLVQGDNAPVSTEAARRYAAALNWLLERHGDRRFRYGVRVGDEDAVVVFWTREELSFCDFLADIFAESSASAEDAIRFAESPWRGGTAPAILPADRFYAVTLSGNASRVVVRDWLEATVGEVKTNVERYFHELGLVDLDGHKGAPPIGVIQRALQATPGATDKRGLSAVLGGRLFRAALSDLPFPQELLAVALRRFRMPFDGKLFLFARAALIKAILVRGRRLEPERHPQIPEEIDVSLDPNCTSVPYLWGRLFAVLEKIQREALEDKPKKRGKPEKDKPEDRDGEDKAKQRTLNATIRDRYFGAASTTPKLVFSRLILLSNHHVSKIKSDPDRRGLGEFFEGIKGEIIDKLEPHPFPAVFNLDEQGLFAIGYYHQRAHREPKRKKDDEDGSESEDENELPEEQA